MSKPDVPLRFQPVLATMPARTTHVRRQREVQAPAPSPGLGEAPGDEGAVVEQHQHGRQRDHLLGGSPKKAGGDRACLPPPGPRRAPPTG